MNELLVVGIVLIIGTGMGHLASRVRLPRISGYLVAGMLMSPAVTGWVSPEMVTHNLTPIVDMGLALIVFTIGGNLNLAQMRDLGRPIVLVAVCAAMAAFGLTVLLFITVVPRVSHIDGLHAGLWKTYLPVALLLGAIACATAAAPILSIIREVRARGPLTTTVLSVVALDNILAIILFGIASTTAAFLTATGPVALYMGKFISFHALGLLGSIAVGVLGAGLLPLAIRGIHRMEILFVVVAGFVLACAGLAKTLHLSLPIACMTFGFVAMNFSVKEEPLLDVFLPVDESVFTLFFAIAGMHLDLSVLYVAALWVPFILVGWFGGKIAGARLGGLLSKAPDAVSRFVGWAILPKAGITIGLILTVGHYLSDPWLAEVVINAVLGATIITEIVAPPLVKRAFLGAGEDQASRAKSRRQVSAERPAPLPELESLSK